MTRLLAALIGVALLHPVSAAKPSLEGLYLAEGTNPDGSQYQAAVAIEARGEAYALTWQLGQGSAIGIGLVQKDVLSVVYGPSGGGAVGLITYAIDGEKLVGKWLIPGDSGVGTETLTKQGAASQPAKTRQGPRIKV